MKHFRNAIEVVNVFNNLATYADSEPPEEGMRFTNGSKFLRGGIGVIVDNVKHDAERRGVHPLPVTSQTKTNYFGTSSRRIAVASFSMEGATASINHILSTAWKFET
jgi:hypothetical protein